jgi:hypothetical protein
MRAQRASFNVFMRGTDAFQLAKWSKWMSMDMPLHFSNHTLKGMAKDMGIKKVPGEEEELIEQPAVPPKPEKGKSLRDRVW